MLESTIRGDDLIRKGVLVYIETQNINKNKWDDLGTDHQ